MTVSETVGVDADDGCLGTSAGVRRCWRSRGVDPLLLLIYLTGMRYKTTTRAVLTESALHVL